MPATEIVPEVLVPEVLVPEVQNCFYDSKIFSDFFEYIIKNFESEKEFNNKILEFFKDEKVVKEIEENYLSEKESYENTKIIKDELVKLNTFLENEKINFETVRTEKEVLFSSAKTDVTENINYTNSLLFIIIVVCGVIGIYKLIYAFIKNFI